MWGIDSLLEDCEELAPNADGQDHYVAIFPEAASKSSKDLGGEAETVKLPCRTADAQLFGMNVTFVEYLRQSFAQGGFMGFGQERFASYRPPEIDELRDGLFLI